MRKVIFVLYFLWGSFVVLLGQENKAVDNQELPYLYELASKNLNYTSLIPEDDLLQLCRKLEVWARKQQHHDELFLIQQISVNSYCLKGDVGLALNKAQQMYDEAKKLNSDVGIVLSIQAIGDTYMHSTQTNQAFESFLEAEKMIHAIDNNFVKIRLLVQQMHVSMLLGDTEKLKTYLVEARKLLDRIEIPDKKDYTFYVQCYQTFYNIAIQDKELARLSLEEVHQMLGNESALIRWYYLLSSQYYDLIKDYEKALSYCDSTLLITSKSKNMQEYKNLMLVKAGLLAANNRKKDACTMYGDARALGDSLNMERYSKQIDSLHVNYWVDRIAIENTAMYNRLLAWVVIGALLALIVVIMLVYIVRKKNKRLVESRKELEVVSKEAEESIQSKNLFLSNMSHELRTPLNAIVGFADLLSAEIIEDAESKQQFGERIRQNADLLVKLFNDVADLSNLKQNNITFTYDTYDAVSVCRNVVDTVENVKQTSASLHFVTSLETLPLYTDTGRLQQLLINLLINATKFTYEGTITLTLEVDNEHQEAIFAVEDTGCGIPKEKQPTIFERFEKLHEGVQGAGLGLSICRLIVEQVGGRIWIDPEYTKGARFVFTHPLSKTPKSPDNE